MFFNINQLPRGNAIYAYHQNTISSPISLSLFSLSFFPLPSLFPLGEKLGVLGGTPSRPPPPLDETLYLLICSLEATFYDLYKCTAMFYEQLLPESYHIIHLVIDSSSDTDPTG